MLVGNTGKDAVMEVKSEPPEEYVTKANVELSNMVATEPTLNLDTTPTLTALLNQPPPNDTPEQPKEVKESYMKLLNLKLAESPVPNDIVSVKVDLDHDVNIELSIDEDADSGENTNNLPAETVAEDSTVEKKDVPRKRKLPRKSRGLVGKETLKGESTPPEEMQSSSDSSDPDALVQVNGKTGVTMRLNLGKDHEEQNNETDTRKYTCLRCGFITGVDDELRSHMLNSHKHDLGSEAPKVIRKKMGVKYHPCDKCDQVFLTTRLLAYHRQTHSKVKVFSCGKCDQAFATFDVLKKHQFEDQGGCLNSYRSSALDQEQKSDKQKKSDEPAFYSMSSSENMRSFNDKGESTYICQYFLSCGFKATNCEQLDEHMKDKHPKTGEQLFTCSLCDFKDYQYGNLVLHRAQHTGTSKKISCKNVWIPPEASMEHLSPDNAYAEDQYHSSDSSYAEPPPAKKVKPIKLKKIKAGADSLLKDDESPAKITKKQISVKQSLSCTLCNYVAKKSSRLDKHMRSHSGEEPYCCLRCNNRGFKTGAELQRHMKKHEEKDSKAKMATAVASDELQSQDDMIYETDPLAGPPLTLPPECQALVDAEKSLKSGKVNLVHLAHSDVSSSEERTGKAVDTSMFLCEECPAAYPTHHALKLHVAAKHRAKIQLACTKCKYKTKEEVLLKRHYLKRHASDAIPKKSLLKAASLVKMVQPDGKVDVPCDSTTVDDELKS